MSMSLEERRQSVESPPSTNTQITTRSDTPNQRRHQLTVTSLNHHYTNENHRSSPTTIQFCQAAVTNSTLKPQQSQTDIMAMHNFGPNSSQHEQQLKNQQQTNSGTETASWHNNNNSNNINNNNNNDDSPPNAGNNDHVNESQQSSVANNPNDHKVSLTDNSKSQAASRPPLNRQQQQQQPQPQLQSQSQQYHGIFSPQIPAILHSTLASRVDQIIRTTLHDSPAYTPPSSRNNNAGINANVITSSPSSNMPQPSSSSSLIFNTTTGSMNTTSTLQNISSHPSNSGIGLMSNATTTAPITSLYGSTLSNMSDNLMSASNSNLAKTSPSHSALTAAAALQSLNQSHVQRSQQQQLAHTQPSPYSSVQGAGSATKPPSNGNGTPMPQAAHGGSIHQMSRLNVTSMSNSDQHNNHLSFPSEQSNVGSLNFSSRSQPNNNLAGPKMVGQSPTIGLSNMNWQDQVHANGMMPRLPPLHGLNGPIPTYSTSSPRNPYGIMNPQLSNSLGSNNGNNMIGSDSDTLSKLNAMKSSPGQTNPMQFRDEKNFPMNFPTLLSNKQNQPNLDNLRGPPPNSTNEATIQANIANEKLVVFAYNLLSQGVPGKPLKKIVHLDDDMKNAIQNGEFYSKFGHIASGIINNQIIVPNFSIIDYLRKDIFVREEVDTIERINGSLSISDLLCLMELVRQRPWNDRSGPEPGKPPQYPDMSPMNVGSSGSNCQPDHLAMTNLHHNSPHKSSSFSSSSPNRSDLLGPQGIDRSRRSSQSPSDISRSQLGNNVSNSKFIDAHNPNHVHQQQASIINSHQFTSPLCPPNQQQQQQQHTPPQNNRTSPFHQPMSIGGVGPSHTLVRPPRSHSTIVGLSTGSFNPPYALTSPQVRQPPAAHQSSSRPNLAGLDMHLISAHTSPSSVPVTAHMSSKTPQTPKLQDSLPRPNSKSVPQVATQFGNKQLGPRDSMLSNHVEFPNHPGRFDLDPNHVMSLQAHVGLRNQDPNNRELSMKRSTTPQYNNMLGSMNNQIDLGRHQELTDSSLSSQSQMNQSNMSNYPINSRDIYNRNLNSSGLSNSTMPPPSMDPRQLTNDLSARNITFAPGIPTSAPNDSQVKQYNALMTAYQQQFMMSGKVGENHNPSGPVNMISQVPAYMIMNQPPGSQRPSVGEPMHVDIIQQAKQPQSQIGSPKLNNQRSIITGSGSASARKSKKAKPSPTAVTQSLETKTSFSDQCAQGTNAPDPGTTMSNDTLSNHNKEIPSTPYNATTNSSMNPAISISNPQTSSTLQDVAESALGNTADATGTSAEIACIKTEACDVNPNETVDARGIIDSAEATIKKETDPVPECPKPIETSNAAQSDLSTKTNDNSESNLYIKAEISTESKQNSNTDCLPNPPIADQPSKYQKLFTKKAWLKNYDLEDQARINGENLTADDTMPVATRSSAKTEDKPEQINQPAVETNPKETKPLATSVKTNGGAKNIKTKVDGKKKAKEGKAKKANSVNSLKAGKVSTIKSTDHDSEETNASTSDLDDTDETDSIRSTSDKKLRRMPRRKVKLSSDRESSDQPNMPNKTKTHKDSSDKETMVRGRGKKEKTSNVSSDAVSGSAKRKYNSDDESVKQKTKKIKESVIKHLEKSGSSPVSKAKKRAGEKFLQTQPCYEIVPKSIRCLECRRVRQSSVKGDKIVPSKQASKTNWDDFCRFFEFRKLRYNKSAQIVVAGFSEAGDAKESDLQLWLPLETSDVPKNISYDVAKFILANIGDEFCKLVSQERLTLESYEAMSGDKRIVWKRAVNGLRELCDVCSTTLFNCHYVCDRCGFVVCIDCHDSRAQNQDDNDAFGTVAKKEISDSSANCENNNTDAEQIIVTNKKSKKDSHGWIFCAKNEEHSHDKLTLTKIIAGNCLEEVWSSLHEIREKLNLGNCRCKKSIKSIVDKHERVGDVSLNGPLIKQEASEETEGSHSTLKGLLLASNEPPLTASVDAKQQATIAIDATDDMGKECKTNTFDESIDSRELDFGSEDDSRQVSAAIEGCIASLAVEGGDDFQDGVSKPRVQDINFNSLNNTSSRLCNGDLLVLTHARHKDNIRLFREHWRHGKPVLVRGVHDRMNIDMWLPQFFLGKFGDYRSDLVDCRNGDIHRQSMRKYWDGFEPSSSKKKFKEDTVSGHIPPANNEEPSAVSTSYYSGSALWRLKDWPPGQDFNEILPEHYDDFMNNLPLKSYTTRTGKLNLACRLPKEMLKPDLGPKMYSAYGTTKFPERGTTNLHLDISDAVNVMVYVGGAMPFKQGSSEYSEIYDSTINDCYVDPVMKDQIRQNKLIPGALWHIFKPSDVTKIREFLNKVSDECKLSKDKRIDPIHDQIWYLDQNLLDRLLREYGVKSYPILQCMGDAILIPAGAPHQVKNLQNCIKVANDFVSPENIRYCLQLTNEFRNLPETHINQEDKLQIKNIMYHSVKESIQYIKMVDSGKVNLNDESSDEENPGGADKFATNQTKAL